MEAAIAGGDNDVWMNKILLDFGKDPIKTSEQQHAWTSIKRQQRNHAHRVHDPMMADRSKDANQRRKSGRDENNTDVFKEQGDGGKFTTEGDGGQRKGEEAEQREGKLAP